MTPAPHGETPIQFEGKSFTLALDWRAIAFFERESDSSLLELWEGLERGRPKLSLFAYLLLAALQRHHAAEVDLDTAGKMAMDDAVRRSLELATGAAMPQGDESSAEGNVESRPKASPPGTKSSPRRSKRG